MENIVPNGNEKHEEIPNVSQESSKEWWREYIPSRPYENPEAYTYRVNNSVYDSSFFLNIVIRNKKGDTEERKMPAKELLEPLVFAEAKKLIKEMPERMPIEEMRREFSKLGDNIRTVTNLFDEKYDTEVDYYSETIKNRDFNGSKPKTSLIHKLFPTEFLTNEHVNELVHEILEDKKIILLGGGDAFRDLIDHEHIQVASIVNVDPFIASETIDKNKNQNYQSLPYHAEDPQLSSLGIEQADEIWATWSVPMYLKTTKDIEQTFKNIDALLKVGGICRVYPVDLVNFKKEKQEIFKDAESFHDRKDGFLNAVAELVNSGRYNLYCNNERLYLQKLST